MTSDPLRKPHPVYPGGAACNPYCPGEHTQYHDGYGDGYEQGERAERERIAPLVEAHAGELCRNDGYDICSIHVETMVDDDRCEDFPHWLPPVLAIIRGEAHDGE